MHDKKSCLPKQAVLSDLVDKKSIRTLAGKLKSQQVVTMRDIRLPEFDKNRRFSQQKCHVFDNDKCNYDLILALDYDMNRCAGAIVPCRFDQRVVFLPQISTQWKIVFTLNVTMSYLEKTGSNAMQLVL